MPEHVYYIQNAVIHQSEGMQSKSARLHIRMTPDVYEIFSALKILEGFGTEADSKYGRHILSKYCEEHQHLLTE